ncbi:MAG: ABC transporter permease [Acidobacteriota bacterium]
MSRATRLYELFLYAYSPVFRARYQDELAATFEAGLADAGDPARRSLFLLTACAGALAHGLAERITGWHPVAGMALDLRSGLRSLARRPGFLLAAAVPVALGVGGVAAVLAVMNGVLLRPLPYEQPERLVKVGRPLASGALASVSTANVIDLEDEVPGLTVAGLMGAQTVVRNGDEPAMLVLARPTRHFMEVFGLTPELGRPFLPDEYVEPHVAILSWSYWQRAWGGDPAAVGAQLETDLGDFRIVGVLPRSWQPPEAVRRTDADAWIPLNYEDSMLEITRAFGFTEAVGRLRPGATIEAVNEQLRAAATSLWEQYPDANSERDGSAKMLEARSLYAETVGDIGGRIGMLLGAVGCLLAIACANVANLFLARGSERERELAMRTVLGAGRRRLVVQLLVECLAVAVLGGLAGLALAYTSLDALVTMTPDLPRAQSVAIDLRVVGAGFAVALIAGLAFGLLPALTTSQRDPGNVLRGGTSTRRGADRLRGALVIGQTALALALVTGGGLLVNSVVRLAMVDLGFRSEGVLAVRPHLSAYITGGEDDPRPFYRAFRDRLRTIPGVQAVSGGMFLPGEGLPVIFHLDDPEGDEPLESWRHTVFPGYFELLDIPIIEGRGLGPEDTEGSARAVVLSRSLARELWPGRPAVGRTLKGSDGTHEFTFTVVGVAEDVRDAGPHEDPGPVLYEAYAQNPWLPSMSLLVRYRGDAAAAGPAVRAALRAVDPTVPLGDAVSLTDLVARNTVQERHYALLLGTFSLIALAIAAVGVYATVSYTVTRRLREMAIRVAVGARAGDVMRLVIGRGLLQVVTGVLLGCVLALIATGVLESLLFGITPSDPATYLLAAAVLIVVALAACVVPALRATRVDPLTIMRTG